jgi:hypothetical protein
LTKKSHSQSLLGRGISATILNYLVILNNWKHSPGNLIATGKLQWLDLMIFYG